MSPWFLVSVRVRGGIESRLAGVRAAKEEEPRQHGALRAHRRCRAGARVGRERVEQCRREDIHRGTHAWVLRDSTWAAVAVD